MNSRMIPKAAAIFGGLSVALVAVLAGMALRGETLSAAASVSDDEPQAIHGSEGATITILGGADDADEGGEVETTGAQVDESAAVYTGSEAQESTSDAPATDEATPVEQEEGTEPEEAAPAADAEPDEPAAVEPDPEPAGSDAEPDEPAAVEPDPEPAGSDAEPDDLVPEVDSGDGDEGDVGGYVMPDFLDVADLIGILSPEDLVDLEEMLFTVDEIDPAEFCDLYPVLCDPDTWLNIAISQLIPVPTPIPQPGPCQLVECPIGPIEIDLSQLQLQFGNLFGPNIMSGPGN